MLVLLSLLCIVAGLAMLLNPELVFELSESWKLDSGAEPSRLFILSTRFGGVMCVLAGIGGVIVPLIS